MTAKEDLLARIDSDESLCDLGYEYEAIDRTGYCLWVIECARHVLPIAKKWLPEQYTQLCSALDTTTDYLEGNGDLSRATAAHQVAQEVSHAYLESTEEILWELSEALDATQNAIALALPNSRVYHEDVIYAAARAACSSELHGEDSDQASGEKKEEEWQRNALRRRLEAE